MMSFILKNIWGLSFPTHCLMVV